MKHLYITVTLLLIIFSSKAQTIFHEDFENPDSVVSSGNPGWVQCSAGQTSGLFCDSAITIPGDSSALTTIPFSTIGAYKVLLNFNCVATSEQMRGYVEVSIDNGITWTRLTMNEYLITPNYDFYYGYFNSDGWCWGISCGGLSIYTPWHPELFDISSLCANEPSVMLRFNMLLDSNSYLSYSGWFIDDLQISGFPYSTSSTPSCNNDGTATLIPYYGSAPYTYSWNSMPVQTTQTATGLPNGTYTCTVTDAGGTSYTDSVIVKSLFSIVDYVNHPTCGMNDGSITVYISSSTNPPYNYTWSNGAISSTITNLSPGTYTLYITDASACVYQKTFVLACGYNGNNLVITKTPSACNAPTGTATVQSFSAATPPFTYEWNTTPIQTTQTATGLGGHSFTTVWVKDANNDSAQSYVYIPFNDTIIAAATYTPTACNGSTGTATGTGTGGVTPYSYLWTTLPMQTTVTSTGLGNATYTLTVTDANGCTDDISFHVPNNVTMNVGMSSTQSQCGLATGTATAFVSGGATPYTYSWSTIPVQTDSNATGLSSGAYNVVITDNSGCSVTKYVYVYDIPMNILMNYISALCNCVNATAYPSGGVAPYTYLWSDGQTTQTDTCVTLGWHYVQVTDASGCQQSQSVYINYPANCFIDIDGDVYADLNYDCIHDVGEYNIANVGLSLVGVNYTYSTYTDNTGHYHFHVLNDNYTLTQYVPTHWNQLCPNNPNTYNINVPGGTYLTLDFADSADSYFDDASIYNCGTQPNTRGFNTNYYAFIKNNGTTLLAGNLVVTHDATMAYINSSPAAAYNVGTHTVNWSYNNLIPGADRQFNFWSYIPAATPLGTMLFDTTYVTPIVTDVHQPDNYCYYNGPVIGSYDPNNKIVLPSGDMHKDSLEHIYTVNFQNTGNSPAVRVIVEDTLDSNLDIATMSDVIASHNFTVDSSAAPVMKFIFDNINLPDSNLYEPQSHGYVSFKIKHKTALASGTEIKNTAYIYFDFNSAVITNTVTNTLFDPNGIEDINKVSLHVFPNPAHDELNISLAMVGGDANHGQRSYMLTLCDVTGRTIKTIPFFSQSSNDVTKLNLKNISNGIYFLKVDDANGLMVASGKVVVE
ncbi:MAG: T9SS type A sorting domain-containing protein [Bacteroidia bacterium]